MPSNEYLQQVTTGEVEELNGEIVRCEYDESMLALYPFKVCVPSLF